MKIFVVKADGSRQLFDREKVIQTCIRLGAEREYAEFVADRIESRLYDGLPTKKILSMIFRFMGRNKPAVKHQICLRRALSLIDPKPDFEMYIRMLLSEYGYKVIPNQIIRGKCTEHEVDAVAKKDGVTNIVEVKHKFNYHAPVGLDVSRIARAVYEDISEGYKLGLNNLKIDKALIICNTKLSNHAIRYAMCRGIDHISWSSPREMDLQTMIEKKRLFPLTHIKGLKISDKQKLSSAGIIILKQLTEKTPRELQKETGIQKQTIEMLVSKAKLVLSQNKQCFID